MIEKNYKEQPRDILKRKVDADRLLKRVKKAFRHFSSLLLAKKRINLQKSEINTNGFPLFLFYKLCMGPGRISYNKCWWPWRNN